MSKKVGQHFLCIVENDKIVSIDKLKPQCMLDLIRFLIKEFGEEEYDSVADIFNYWPVDFSLGYKKPVQYLYIDTDEDTHEVVSTGFIVYAYNRTKAEEVMQYFLNGDK